MPKYHAYFLAVLFGAFCCVPGPAHATRAELQELVQSMKDNPRGPFAGISWFCNDGTVHPARPYPCEDRGDGRQHGRLGPQALQLREAGYLVANVLAAVDVPALLDDPDAGWKLKQMALEKFLVQADDGWILRQAQYYRGAFQIEDEDAAGRAVLLGLLQKTHWRDERFAELREAVRLLPHGEESPPVTRMRQLSKELNERDDGFRSLRIKLHNVPEPGDAALVREYARQQAPEDMRGEYEDLAALLDDIHFNRDLPAEVRDVAGAATDTQLARYLRANVDSLGREYDPGSRFMAACSVLGALRSRLEGLGGPEQQLAALDLSLAVENLALTQGTVLVRQLRDGRVSLSRLQLLGAMKDGVNGLYGLGFLSERERLAAQRTLRNLLEDKLSLQDYALELRMLSRVPEWCERTLRYHFGAAVEHLAELEPKTRTYFQDRLRASHLLPWSGLLERLAEDASRLSGVRHGLFGRTVGTGLTPLNPGLARGRLYVWDHEPDPAMVDPQGIHMLPETVEELPAVAGILTAGRGNLLSHVQLLARNLGVPNVAVDLNLRQDIAAQAGQIVTLAVSPGGVVRLQSDDPAVAQALAAEETPDDFLIPADQGKLDLKQTGMLNLDGLRAVDSGRVCGPKAANLGELKNAFPWAVTEGVVVPFGAFAQVLERPAPGESRMPMRKWLKKRYKHLRKMDNGPQRRTAGSELLATVRGWMAQQPLDPALVDELRAAMDRSFGPDGSYGVFVRSDTNVEDLPGFTGAGLNKTVPNVVGFQAVLEAVAQVWASPFTERAYGWRQSHMENPEELYVSTLIMKSVPVQKSGVLVTADLADSDPQPGKKLTVAVNFGVGGAVAGQSAEELLIDAASGKVRLLAEAAQPVQRVLDSGGGLAKLPAPKAAVLGVGEVNELRRVAARAPGKFSTLRDEDGRPLPADIEFGFKDGKLALFQIRPLRGSVRARTSAYLRGLDVHLADSAGLTVNMTEPPRVP